MLAADLQLDYEQPAAAWYARWNHQALQAASVAAGEPTNEWFSEFIGPRRFQRNDWIVRLTAEATQSLASIEQATTLLNQNNIDFQIVAGLGLPGLLHFNSLSSSAAEVETSLATNSRVASFAANDKVAGLLLPNDSDFGNMTGLHNVGQFGATNDADIDAPEAWDTTRGSSSVVVGVIDSGVDATHPDLYLNIWLNQGEITAAKRSALTDTDSDGVFTFYDLNNAANAAQVRDLNTNGYIDAIDLLDDPLWADGRDTDGNGFTDDFFGWNFRTDSKETFAPNNPSDVLGHGTHVAGTIGAIGNNARGVAGINWRSSIMALKFLDVNNQGDTASAIAAVNYASMMRTQFNTNVRVLNNSWGQPGGSNVALKNTIEASGNAGILFVAAAGNGNILGQGVDNDRTSFYPASYELDNVIAVGASDGTDRLAGFSNYGLRGVDIVAPGVGVRSTLPGGRYGEANGTSMATPHVSGSAALVWSLQPDATVPEIRRALLEQGDLIPAIGSQISTGRRLNANKSLSANVFAPTVQLVSATNITTAGGTEQLITVKYKNRLGVDKASLGNSDIVVTRQAALDETLATTLVSSTENANKTEVTAVYRLAAVGGTWDAQDYGNYSITAQSDAARSLSGLATRETTVGSFQVKIAAAGIFYVDTFLDTVDTNPGDGLARDASGRTSLRAAIQEANALFPSPVKIFLQTGTYPLTIGPVIDPAVVFAAPGPGSGYDAPANLQWSNASTGDLDLRGNITIVGLGVNRTTIDAKGIDRVMKVYAGSTVSITGLTLTGGNAPTNHSGGGVLTSGNLSLDLVTINNNQAIGGPVSLGGGISQWSGNLTVFRSTLESNMAVGGGGLFVTNGATANLDSSTLVTNVANGNIYGQKYQMGGGGVLTRNSGRVEINNSTLSDNSAAGIALGDAIRNSHGSRDADAFPAQISGDGKYLVMAAFGRLTEVATSPYRNIYVFNRETGEYELVSVDSAGVHANRDSIFTSTGRSISTDGRFVAFQSTASNLVPGDNNDTQDIFVHDRQEKKTIRVSAAGSGSETNEQSQNVALSGDGKFVAFTSFADNLVPGDVNGTMDVFVREVENGTTRIASVNQNGDSAQGDNSFPAISGDGRFVSFQSDANTLVPNDRNQAYDAFVKDMQTGAVDRVSVSSQGVEGNSTSSIPSLSFDGRYVAFYSMATNLVAGDNNGKVDIFIFDRQTRVTRLVSKTVDGVQSNGDSTHPTISGNGRYVVFNSDASNLVPGDTNGLSDFFWVDTETAEIIKIPYEGPLATFAKAIISDDGRWVNITRTTPNFAGVGDSDNLRDSYTFDTLSRTLVQDTPREGIDRGYYNGITLSGSNRFITYSNWSTDLLGEAVVRVKDTVLGTTTLISRGQDGQPANAPSSFASADDGGNLVAFRSAASNLVLSDSNSAEDLFLFDRTTQEMRRIATADPSNPTLTPARPRISSNGARVVYQSTASHLVAGDTNNAADIFVYDVMSRTTKIVSDTFDKLPSNGVASSPIISGDGKKTAFVSTASNLVPGDTNGVADFFVFDLETETIQLVSKSQDGQLGNQSMPTDNSVVSAINYDGSKIVFVSKASNLVPGDSNGVSDVFMFNRTLGQVTRVNLGEFATEANGVSYRPTLSSDGRYVGFMSLASNIVSTVLTPASQFGQYFIHDTLRQTTDLLTLVSPQSLFGDFSFDSLVMSPQFTGPYTIAAYVGRTLTSVNLTTKEVVAYQKTSLPVPNQVTINQSTLYSSRLPNKSIGQEIIDGEMTVTNSVVSMPSTQSDGSMNAGRNESMPTYFNTSFAAPGEIDPLADNGGPTRTHRIPLTSSAFQAIRSFQNELLDQRGQIRNGVSDAGAFENVGSTISGRVFVDANGNKIFDIDEVGIPDAEVFVDVNRDGIRSEEELSVLTLPDNLTTVSANESGEFTLENIPPGYVAVVAYKNGPLSDPTRGQDPLPTKSFVPSMGVSGDGRYVVFSSDETNLVPNDTNGVRDIFMWDRTTGKTKRLSVSSTGAQANNTSDFASISSDGLVVAFQSAASNLVGGDTNGAYDVFVHYVNTGITRRISVDQAGLQGNGGTFNQIAINSTGKKIAFASRASNLAGDPNGVADIFVKDLSSGLLSRISQIDNATRIDSIDGREILNASFSDDFQFVTFVSALSSLVPNDTNGNYDIFLLNRSNGETSRINLGPSGEQANNNSDHAVISGDGRIVAFTSRANNLFPNDRGGDPDLFIYDRVSGTVRNIVAPPLRGGPMLSANGSTVGMLVYTGTLGNYRLIDLNKGTYTSVVSNTLTNTTFSSVLASEGTHVVVGINTKTYVWENVISQGPVVRLSDATKLRLDFPIKASPGSISGRVFVDSVKNERFDVGEVGVANIRVFVDSNSNGLMDSSEISRVTNSEGYYLFSDLSAERTYRLLVSPSSGLEQVFPQSPGAWPVYLNSGAKIADRDFGFIPSSTGGQFENAILTGKLFNDLNGDGLIQNGESPLAGVTVYLDLNSNEVRDFNEPRAVTDNVGSYSFAGLGNRPYTVRTLLGTGTVQTSPLGTKFATTPYTLTTGSTQLANPQDVIAEDLNGDGWTDLAVALFSGNSVAIRLNDKAGGFGGAPVSVSVAPDGLGPIALASGKLNSGTVVDMISANQLNGTATILLDFNGTGFASKQTLSVGETPTDVVVGKFDADADFDAIVANQSRDQLTLLVNNGSGVFTKGASFSSGGKKPTALVTGLFNNDAFVDIAVANYGTHPTGGDFGNVAVLLGRGDGTFQTAVPSTVGFGPISIATDDFNGDGFLDLVTANFLANTASLLLGSASGTFTVAAEQLSTGQGPLQVQLQDIEGDGDKDILVTNLLSQTISVLRNRRSQGGSGFEPAENFGVAEFSTAPRLAFAAGDFDKSTTADIAIINSLSDSLKIMRNTLVNGAHRIQLTGVENVTNLNFGTRPDVLLPRLDPIDNPESLVEDAPQQTVTLNGIALGRIGGPALRITASSANTSIIPTPTIDYVAGATTGQLKFTPAKDASGQVAITVTTRDAGADRLLDTADDAVLSRVFTVSIKPVNDAPTFDFPASRSVTAPEDSGARTVSGFITNITTGGGSYESAQTLSAFLVVADNLGLFSTQPMIDATGTLRFTPAPDAVGTATVTVTLTDSGDTAFGGTNRKVDQFVLIINPVNDPPSITIGGKQTVLVGAAAQSVSGFATGFMPGGGADENAQVIAGFAISVDKPDLFSVLPTIDSAGTLRYTPSTTRTRMAKVSVQVRDDGGSNNGGVDLSTLKTFDIEVAPLPDTVAPTPVLSSLSSTITNASPIDLTVDFGEAVTGFTLSDLVLTNATASNLTDLGSGKFTVAITATVDGVVTVSVPAAAAKDLANNNSLESTSFTRTVDRVSPVTTITTTEPSPTNKQSFPVVFNFGEAVTGFDVTDLVLGNGTASTFSETAPGRYTAIVTAISDGVVFIGFSGGVGRDAAGNGNTSPVPLLISVNTGAASYKPLVLTTESSITSNRNFLATIDFGRIVTGFVATDLELTNATGAISDLSNGRYQLNLSAVSEGIITVRLPADRVRDANNRPNEASDTLTIRFVDATDSDFGDAPTSVQSGFTNSYPTRLADNGAFHKRSALFLGTSSDAESDGQSNATATGDDTIGGDDENGILFPLSNVIGVNAATTSSFIAIASATGFLDAWIDFDRDGDWSDAGEQIATKLALVSGSNSVAFTIPLTASAGTTFARFRLSTAGGLAVTGPAFDGEVEDHTVTLVGGATKTVSLNAAELGAHEIMISNGLLVLSSGGKTLWSAPASEIAKLTTLNETVAKLFEVSVPGTNLPGTVRYIGSGKPIELVSNRSSIDLATLSADKLFGIGVVDLRTSGVQNLTLRRADVRAINSAKSLRILMDQYDTLGALSDWKSQTGRVENNIWVQPYISDDATIEVVSATPWQNKVNPIDVNGDQGASPLDVLELINQINANSFPGGLLPARGSGSLQGFYDPDGDGSISPLDVLNVINSLNRAGGGEGEGESTMVEQGDIRMVDHLMAADLSDILDHGPTTTRKRSAMRR